MKPNYIQSIRMRLHHALLRFRDAAEGVIAVEMVVMLPFLIWMTATSFELYEVHRFKANRVKATYTVADLLSREMLQADTALLNTAETIFDAQTMDDGVNQLRMSVVRFIGATETYEVVWSRLRGDGPLTALTTSAVADAHDELPLLEGGEELIIVESHSVYMPAFEFPGLNNDYTVSTRVFTGIRFLPQLCFECAS